MESVSREEWLKKKDDVIKIIKKSRKAYFTEYFCGFFLLGLLFYFRFEDISIPLPARYFIVGMAVFAIGSAEISRSIMRYKILHTKIMMIHGFVKQTKKNVYFHPLGYVPDINYKQTRWQRFLGYGTIYFRGSEDGTFELKDIDHPEKNIRLIEDLIEINKHMESKRK